MDASMTKLQAPPGKRDHYNMKVFLRSWANGNMIERCNVSTGHREMKSVKSICFEHHGDIIPDDPLATDKLYRLRNYVENNWPQARGKTLSKIIDDDLKDVLATTLTLMLLYTPDGRKFSRDLFLSIPPRHIVDFCRKTWKAQGYGGALLRKAIERVRHVCIHKLFPVSDGLVKRVFVQSADETILLIKNSKWTIYHAQKDIFVTGDIAVIWQNNELYFPIHPRVCLKVSNEPTAQLSWVEVVDDSIGNYVNGLMVSINNGVIFQKP